MKKLTKEEKREIKNEMLKEHISRVLFIWLLINVFNFFLIFILDNKLDTDKIVFSIIMSELLPSIFLTIIRIQTSYDNTLEKIRGKEKLDEIFQEKDEILVNDISETATLPPLYYYATKNSECDNIIITRFHGEKRILVETILTEDFFKKYKIL